MSTSVEHVETHALDPHFLVARARVGVLLLILSDALSVIAILSAGGYLSALNTLGQFRLASDHPSTVLLGVLLAVVLAVAGIAYLWWQLARRNQGAGLPAIFLLSWVCMIAATVIQIVIGVTLGYSTPYHAYESVILLITWFSAIHLLLTSSFTGLLVFGRLLRGRLAGREYIVEVHGYWWYYTVIAGLIMLLFSVLL